MAENNKPSSIRTEAEKIIKTMDGINEAFENALGRLDKSVTVKYDDQQILLSQSVSTAINNAPTSIIREFVSESEITALIATMHLHKNQYLTLLTDGHEKSSISSSMEWSVAETEAKLKGFVVSSVYENQEDKATVLKQGKRDQIERTEIERREKDLEQATAEKSAVQTAILNLSGKNVPLKDYPEKVSQEAQKLLKRSGKEFSPGALEQCRSGGKKTEKQQFSEPEKVKIAYSIAGMINKLRDKLNEVDYKKVETEVVNNLAKSVNDKAIKALSAKGYKVNNARQKKIDDHMSPILLKFDSKYLEKYGHKIAEDISEKLMSKKSWSSLLSSNYTISTKELEKIAKDINDKHFTAYLKVSTTDIENKISQLYSSGKGKELNESLANSLTQFLRETNKTIEVGEKSLSQVNVTDLKKITNAQLASVRELDRKRFDELIFPSPPSKHSLQEILNEPQLATQELPIMVQELSQVFKKGHVTTASSPPQHLAPLSNRSRTSGLGKS